jgi:hypothetical protein
MANDNAAQKIKYRIESPWVAPRGDKSGLTPSQALPIPYTTIAAGPF